MNHVIERDRKTDRHLEPNGRRMPTQADHDWPLLALEHSPCVHIEWESLIDDGITPSLVLGAERRWRGSR